MDPILKELHHNYGINLIQAKRLIRQYQKHQSLWITNDPNEMAFRIIQYYQVVEPQQFTHRIQIIEPSTDLWSRNKNPY